jgi:UDP-glucose 4-epimerase
MLRASGVVDHRPKGISVTTALITGGAGFIGSNLADALVAEGRTVHVVDDLSNGQAIRVPDEAELHAIDVRAAAGLTALVELVRPRTIFHLAAQADVRKALEDPGFDADVNVIGTINVLEAARAVGARVVFTSTGGAAYGEHPDLEIPTPETAEPRPLSHYGMSKIAGEGYLRLYGRLYGTEAVALRLANVYGPRQDHHGEAGVVAIFCGLILDGQAPRVFGDGLQTRDYVYVGDVVRALLAGEAGPAGVTFNVGVGREVTVLELIEGLGYEGEPELLPARLGELQRSALDPSMAERVWGWRAQTPLDEGLRITLESVAAARRAPGSRPPGAFAPA